MLDRLSLVKELDREVRLPAASSAKAAGLYDKLLALLVVELSLLEARNLGGSTRSALRTFIDGAMSMTDLKKLSKRWDPKRAIGRDTTQTEVRRSLCDLLDRKAEPYAPPPRTRSSQPRRAAALTVANRK